MHLRSLALAGALAFGATTASAQFVELLTEAPVAFSVTLQTNTVTETETSRSSSIATTRLSQAQVLEDLRAAGVIQSESIAGWSLVAVRPPMPDLALVDAKFVLYAVNRTEGTSVRVPEDKFLASSKYYAFAAKYVEKHQGQYVYSSKGTVTTHVVYQYRPSFSAAGSSFEIDAFDAPDSSGNPGAAGFAKINFLARDLADGFEVFTFAITSLSISARGGFSASVTGDARSDGIMTLVINVGAPKLVAADLYPDVETNPFDYVLNDL